MASDIEKDLDYLDTILTSEPRLSKEVIETLSQNESEMTSEQRARFLVSKSILSILSANYSLALETLKKAEGFSSSRSLLSSIYLYQATSLLALKDYSSALGIISKNLSGIEKLDDVDIKAGAYLRLANLYYDFGAYEEMAKYAQLTYGLSKGNNLKNQCYSLLYLAVFELKTENFTGSIDKFNKSRNFCLSNKFPLIAAMSLKGLGLAEIKMKNFENAEFFLLMALDEYTPFQYQEEIFIVHSLLSQVYQGNSQLDKALFHAQLVMESAGETINLESKLIATNVLAELFNEKRDFKKAFNYLKQHQTLSKNFLNDTKAKANAYQMAKFENGEKNREIRLLNKDRELYTAKAELTESQRNNEHMMFLLICGSLVVLTLFAINMTLQKRKYMRLAQFDALTGIFNRGTGQNLAENRYIKDSMSGIDFSVVLFDLDRFKSINDNYGHAMGDWVLKKVCEVVSKECRSSDIFTRFGGEEFVLFMPNTSESVAREKAEKCKARILAIDTRYSGHEFTISASFGVATSTEKDLSLDPILQRADIAMYQSKEQGRQCT